MSIRDLTGDVAGETNDPPAKPVVDLVAVHGFDEDAVEAWTHAESGKLWLRDILPQYNLHARLLVFEYHATIGPTSAQSSNDRILSLSTTLVSGLIAERKLDNALKRPIIFVGHGLGGLLIKKALVISQAGTLRDDSRRSIFNSTCAIMFFGTPHEGVSNEIGKLPLHQRLLAEPNQLMQASLYGSEILQEITDQFSVIIGQFIIWCFWEQKKTQTRFAEKYIVEYESASMIGEDVNRSGLPASHYGMCKFADASQPGFNIILAALKSIFDQAPAMIHARWADEKKALREKLRSEERAIKEAQALLRSDSFPESQNSPVSSVNEYFIVPRPAVSIFTGLKDLTAELKSKMLPLQTATQNRQNKVFVIHGIGGAGKTQFCLKFVEEVRQSFWGVFWIDASNYESLQSGFSNIGREAKKNATFEAGKYWLSCSSKPWLLVLDNADDPNMDISEYFPSGGIGHILVTTRNPDVCIHATIGSKKLWEMDQVDAITLLLKSASLPGSIDFTSAEKRRQAQPITDTLGRLALALTHAGAAIRRNICTLETYPQHYSTHWKEVMRSAAFQDKSDYRCTISTTWEVPFRQISCRSSRAHMDAVEIIHIFAFYHFDQIPVGMFKRSWTNLQQSSVTKRNWRFFRILNENFFFPQGTQPLLFEQDSHRWDNSRLAEAMSVLTSYGLIEFNSMTDTCTMHPVVQDWARDRMNNKQRHYWLEIATRLIADSISDSLESSGRSYRRSIKLHIDTCFRRWVQYRLPFPASESQAKFATKFAAILAENGIWNRARDILQTAWTVQVKYLGSSHPTTLCTLADLGHSHWNLDSRKSALETHQIVYETKLQTCGTADPSLYVSLVDLTRSCWLNGQLEQSKKYGELAMQGLKNILGDADYQTLNAKHNLGRTYSHLGFTTKAYDLLLETLQLREIFFGDRHADTLETMNELGVTLYRLGNLKEARDLITRALKLRTSVLGEHHAYTLWSVNDLSKILIGEREPLQARVMLEEIIPVVRETLGAKHVGMMMTLGNLAMAHAALGDHEAAEKLLRELTQIQDKNHPDWFKVMCALARTLEKLHKYQQAETTWNDAITHVSEHQILSKDHQDVQRARGSLKKIAERHNYGLESLAGGN